VLYSYFAIPSQPALSCRFARPDGLAASRRDAPPFRKPFPLRYGKKSLPGAFAVSGVQAIGIVEDHCEEASRLEERAGQEDRRRESHAA
jgi:hypothetical protein